MAGGMCVEILPGWARCLTPGTASARALPAAEWRRGVIQQLCLVRLRLQGAAARDWSWGACTRARGLQAPGRDEGGACQGQEHC